MIIKPTSHQKEHGIRSGRKEHRLIGTSLCGFVKRYLVRLLSLGLLFKLGSQLELEAELGGSSSIAPSVVNKMKLETTYFLLAHIPLRPGQCERQIS